jgi:DNA-binding NtrC family response regulator
MVLPRILVIDDELGVVKGCRNRERENFCLTTGLRDVTGDADVEEIPDPVAEAEFLRGQVGQSGYVENDLLGTLDRMRARWRQSPRWSLLLLDLHFRTGTEVNGVPEGRAKDCNPEHYFGLRLLDEMRRDPLLKDLPVVVLSSMDRSRIEESLSEFGAIDFHDKSLLTREAMQELLEEHGLIEDDVIIGRSVAMLDCLRMARRRSKLGNDNVLVLGETGTGKELLARYIHSKSGRRGQYIPLFTQGVPETLIEDRLFGHIKGAFNRADKATPGAAELAHNGTLFIDEFGDIPMSIQTKLLRLLDKHIRESQRLGASEAKQLDLLVVMATSQPGLVAQERVRADLMFRVHADDALRIPPLRQRPDDIPILAMHFLRKYEESFHADNRTISEEAMERLSAYHWPGNVRELERTIEQAVFNYRGLRVLSSSHLNLDGGGFFAPPAAERTDDGGGEVPRMAGKQSAPGGVSRRPATARGESEHIAQLLIAMADFPVDHLETAELSGALSRIQETYAELAARLLKAALLATSRPTPGVPEGQIFVHPAMKLITGDARLTASKAADLIKKLFTASPQITSVLLQDPVLKEAYETAIRLRPRQPRGKGDSGADA